MSFGVLEGGGYPVVPRGPAIVKTGTTVRNYQRGPDDPRGFVDYNSPQDLKEGLQAFGGLEMHGKS